MYTDVCDAHVNMIVLFSGYTTLLVLNFHLPVATPCSSVRLAFRPSDHVSDVLVCDGDCLMAMRDAEMAMADHAVSSSPWCPTSWIDAQMDGRDGGARLPRRTLQKVQLTAPSPNPSL